MLMHASALRSRLSFSVRGSRGQQTPGSLTVAMSFGRTLYGKHLERLVAAG